MRIQMAQIEPVLGDIDANVDRAVQTLKSAADDRVDLVVFPELFLTGAAIGRVEADLGMNAGDPRLGRVVDATRNGPAADIGFVHSDRRTNFYNTAAYIEDGRIVHLHRKVYLVTYDIFEEGKYFEGGSRMRSFDTAWGRMATLVCNDAWQPPLVFVAVQDGAQVLIIPANSGESSFDSIANTRSYWRQITQFYASLFQCYVVFVNRVGQEGGIRYWGGSHVVDPWGEVVQEAPLYEEAMVPVEIDLANVRKRRRQFPFLKESHLDMLAKEMRRIADEADD